MQPIRGRNGHGTGYVAAIVGVASALVVLIVGASTIVAVGKTVPNELWAIGGALVGALAGILMPAPRERTRGEEEAPVLAAEHTIKAASKAAETSAEEALKANKARLERAVSAVAAVRLVGCTEEKAASPDAGQPAPEGSARTGAASVVTALQAQLGTSAQSNPTGDPASEILQAAIEAAQGAIPSLSDDTAAANGVETGVKAAAKAAETAAQDLLKKHEVLAKAVAEKVNAAEQNVKKANDDALQLALKTNPSQSDSAAVRPALMAATGVLQKQTETLTQQKATSGDVAGEAAEKIHAAAVSAAKDAVGTVEPAKTGPLATLRSTLATLLEPKIALPLFLFLLTLGLGIALGLGVIHVKAACSLTKTPEPGSPCLHYTEATAEAAKVLVSLAATTVGALVGVFASKPSASTGAPPAASGS